MALFFLALAALHVIISHSDALRCNQIGTKVSAGNVLVLGLHLIIDCLLFFV